MATRLTKSEIQLLKELKAAGEHGRRIAGTSSAEIAHLIGARYIKRLPGMKLYSITERGRQVLAQVTAGKGDLD
jgi:DNA-binding MarR family transcriptional regulator